MNRENGFLTILCWLFKRGEQAVAILLLAVAAQAQQGTAMSASQSSAVANQEHGITARQADEIIEELQQIRWLLERQQQANAVPAAVKPPTGATVQRVQISVGSGSYSLGRTDAPVTIVEFADYQCPFCRHFQVDAYSELKKKYIDTGKVRFISRDLPLEMHPYALKAAEAARCAGEQHKYWEMREALIRNISPWTDQVIEKPAEGLLLDMKSFHECLNSEKYKMDVLKDAGEATKLQISGTPAFVLARSAKDKLDGVLIGGAQPFATFESAIDALLKESAVAGRESASTRE